MSDPVSVLTYKCVWLPSSPRLLAARTRREPRTSPPPPYCGSKAQGQGQGPSGADNQPLPLTLSCQRRLLSGASKGSTTHPPCSQGSNWLSPEGFRVILLKIVSFSDQSSTHCCLGDMCWGRCGQLPQALGGSTMSPLGWGPTPASNQPQFWSPKARPAQSCPDSPAHPGSLLAGSTVGVQRNIPHTHTPEHTRGPTNTVTPQNKHHPRASTFSQLGQMTW